MDKLEMLAFLLKGDNYIVAYNGAQVYWYEVAYGAFLKRSVYNKQPVPCDINSLGSTCYMPFEDFGSAMEYAGL